MNVNEDAIEKKGATRIGEGRRNGWEVISTADTQINRVKSGKVRRSEER